MLFLDVPEIYHALPHKTKLFLKSAVVVTVVVMLVVGVCTRGGASILAAEESSELLNANCSMQNCSMQLDRFGEIRKP